MVHRAIIRNIILYPPPRRRRIGDLSLLFMSRLRLATTYTTRYMIVPQIWIIDGNTRSRFSEIVLLLLLLLASL